MTFNNIRISHIWKQGIQTKTIQLLAIIAIVGTIFGAGNAFATTVTNDKGLGCGHYYWGIKNAQNDNNNGWSFGRSSQASPCTSNGVTSYYGRNNTAVLETDLTGSYGANHYAWQAIMQGCDPFGTYDGGTAPSGCTTSGGASQHNSNFPLAATNSYNLKLQWVWTNDLLPTSGDTSMHANFLTNLWLQDKVTGHTNDVLVIDFLSDRLKYNSTDNKWGQDVVTDQDSSDSGVQYYQPFCEVIGSQTIYHYNVVLENVVNSPGVWRELTPSINSYIDNAFSASYTKTGSCGSSTLPDNSRSNWNVVDQESGIELQNGVSGETGKVKGAYSWSELWY